MSLIDRINDEMKDAMRARAKERLSALRFIRAGIIEEQKAGKGEVEDAAVLKLMRRMVKQRRDAAGSYREGGREDLATREEGEIAVIEEFLPKLADRETTKRWVDEAIEASGASSMSELGKAMGLLMKSHRGEIDGGLARSLIQEALSG